MSTVTGEHTWTWEEGPVLRTGPLRCEKIEPVAETRFDRAAFQSLGLDGVQFGSFERRFPRCLNVDIRDLTDGVCLTEPGRLFLVDGSTYFVQLDVREQLPFTDGCFDWAYAEHLIEHIQLLEAVSWLTEVRRVLTPGGLVRLTTPDLRRYVAAYLSDDTNFFGRYRDVFRGRGAPPMPDRPAFMVNHVFRYWEHCWIYDAEELRYVLDRAGFSAADMRICSFGKGERDDIAALDAERRTVETIYVEIDKEGANPVLRYDTRTVETAHTDQFGDLHVNYFDIFNRKKDYQAEVDQVHAIFAREGTVSSVLDIGCGTARHLELLAECWYEVVGVDRSAPMVRQARQRLARFGPRASVVEADLFELSLEREFDAVTMMFSLLGCFVSNEKVLDALAVTNRHLRPGGLLVLDVFDATALLPAKSPLSGGSVQSGGRHPLLAGHATAVNTEEQVLELALQMWELDGDRLLDQMHETHVIRYFAKRELRLLLAISGFELIGYTPMSATHGNPAQPWLRQAAARKVGAPREEPKSS